MSKLFELIFSSFKPFNYTITLPTDAENTLDWYTNGLVLAKFKDVRVGEVLDKADAIRSIPLNPKGFSDKSSFNNCLISVTWYFCLNLHESFVNDKFYSNIYLAPCNSTLFDCESCRFR